MFNKRFHMGHLLSTAIMVAAIATALILIARPTTPATDSASLSLTGAVTEEVDVAVTATGIAGGLNLATDHIETALKVADVTERSNVPAGYAVVVQSANRLAGGRCGGASACLWSGTEDVPFTLLQGAVAQTFSGATTTWRDVNTTQLTNLASVANIAYDLTGTILPQGTYTETLTFTITSK